MAVAVVLADSSVVTIALPRILVRYDVTVGALAWTLTAYNLALALAAIPAAYLGRRRLVPLFGVGAVAFALASFVCAFAPSFGVLVGGRALQGVAGAAVVCAALGLLAAAVGDEVRAVRRWAFAGIVGAAVGPAVGGILTQLLGWQWIFGLQTPVMLAGATAAVGARVVPRREAAGRPHLRANAALLLVSGALVAALFLLVILLIDGWRLDPLAAGIVVSVMPLAAIAATRYSRAIEPPWARAASGVVLICGGLAALGWLPRAGAAWTIPPQLAVGVGLGLSLATLTEQALAGSAEPVDGGWTIASRHAGVVLGLLLLTPIFTADLDRNEHDALRAGTAVVLDSRIPPLDKIGVARDVLVSVDEAESEARIPDVKDVLGRHDDPAYADLARDLQDQLDRAVTNAFSRSFLAAAVLSLLALVPVFLMRREPNV